MIRALVDISQLVRISQPMWMHDKNLEMSFSQKFQASANPWTIQCNLSIQALRECHYAQTDLINCIIENFLLFSSFWVSLKGAFHSWDLWNLVPSVLQKYASKCGIPVAHSLELEYHLLDLSRNTYFKI